VSEQLHRQPRWRAFARARAARRGAWIALWVVLAALPIYLSQFWEQTGLFAMAAIIGAIGLTVLVGTAGQLSLGHAFFVAVGAYGYSYFAGRPLHIGVESVSGLGLHPVLAMLAAVVLAGLAGALFSPIASRLRGISLGVASLGLVFIGQQILFNSTKVTGGFNGRLVPIFKVPGFSFGSNHPGLTIFGVSYGPLERLWYLGLILVAVSYWYGRNLVRSRPGRALEAIRDGEIAASVMGVDVRRYKALVFTLSSMYAGLAGVLYALAIGQVVPDSFDFNLSISYLVMIVIGGLGSIGGAVVGAIFVSVLPQALDHYSGSLPLVSPTGTGSLDASHVADFLYGAAVVLVLLFAPGGLAGFGIRLRERLTGGGAEARRSVSTAESPETQLNVT
jgi:branched-chain amino acid transport system permease protein